MDGGSVTTPFGRRPMTLGMLANQYSARNIEPGQSADKWKLFRAICEAKPMLGVTDRALAVLNALLSFYPGNELSEEKGLIVFPSNAQLSIRAHGIAPATLRRHLAALVEAGLLIRRDSPNGKRYARRDSDGEVDQAFGFSIAPLLARCSEIQSYAAQVLAERQLMRSTRERLSLCRRDIAKLIETALAEGVAGNWIAIHELFRGIVLRIPRSPSLPVLEALVDEMEMLRAEILNILETRINSKNMEVNESQIEQHIQNSKTKSIPEFEPAQEEEQGKGQEVDDGTGKFARAFDKGPYILGENHRDAALKSFPLGFVLQACPEMAMYGPGGRVSNWRDMMAAAVVVRSMLGISPSAYEDACAVMGAENAATVVACLLERAGSINSAGGYLRDLTRRTEQGEFAIGPMLMSLVRAGGLTSRKAG